MAKPRSTYLDHIVDNEYTMREYGSQAVVWQTAINPVVALELLDEGVVEGHRSARTGGIPARAVPRAIGGARLSARADRDAALRGGLRKGSGGPNQSWGTSHLVSN